ncbi:MAG: cell division protein ZapA [Crocinitomicaceae bacterium]|nr:cell division protein ZapA [Crocinitomicaceae bacterium]
MNELSIKVTIAGRTYPLTIDRSEEEKIRVAVSKINDNIKDLRDNYAVKDTQDLLAMTALQFSTQSELLDSSVDADKLDNALNEVNDRLKSYLTK